MIILLDLNFTLVENSKEKYRPFIIQIGGERYRTWLVELLQAHHVILMTARPDYYKAKTLESIENKTGWQPQEAYFNSYNLPPQHAKERMLKEHVFPKHSGQVFQAIESNPATRSMYARYKIPAVKISDGEIWYELPF